MSYSWQEEYRECSEDRRHYAKLTWQIPSAILVVDSVVIGFAFSGGTHLPALRGAAVLFSGIFSLILAANFWKFAYRSNKTVQRLQSIEYEHGLRRLTEREPWHVRMPLRYITTIFLTAVSLAILVVGVTSILDLTRFFLH